MSNNGGQLIVVSKIRILFQSDRFQMNYTNPLLYPVIMSVRPSPEHGILGTSIEGLTLKSALLLFTQIRAREKLKISILMHITRK